MFFDGELCWALCRVSEQNVVKTLLNVKIYYTDTSTDSDRLSPSPRLVVNVYRKHDFFSSAVAALPCAYSKRNSVSSYRFILEYQISIKKKIFFSPSHSLTLALFSSSFICDVIPFRLELLKRICILIYSCLFFMALPSILISLSLLLSMKNIKLHVVMVVGLAFW